MLRRRGFPVGCAALAAAAALATGACGGGGGGGPPPPPTPSPFTVLNNQPPQSGYLSLLLTDGSVMMQSNADASVFYKVNDQFTLGVEGHNLINANYRQLMQQHIGMMTRAVFNVGPSYSVLARYSF